MGTADSQRRLMPQPNGPAIPKIAADAIMRGGKEVVIVHGTAEYRLRITSSDKLILTK